MASDIISWWIQTSNIAKAWKVLPFQYEISVFFLIVGYYVVNGLSKGWLMEVKFVYCEGMIVDQFSRVSFLN